MKNTILLFLILIVGCKKNTISTPTNPNNIGIINQDPQKILGMSIRASNTDLLFDATISFTHKNATYLSKRKGHEYEFTMSRIRNGINYTSTSTNGNFEYKENGNLASQGSNNTLLEKQIAFFNNFIAIPAIFKNDTSIEISSKPQTRIKQTDYRVLQVDYKSQMPTDVISDVRLYINPKTILVDYICYRFERANNRFIWREAKNRRVIKGITFSDYITYSTKANVLTHEDMVSLFNTGGFQKQESFIIKDLQVELNSNK